MPQIILSISTVVLNLLYLWAENKHYQVRHGTIAQTLAKIVTKKSKMKKIAILTLLIVSFILQKTNAQILRDVGIKTGISISKQNWTYNSIDKVLKKDYRIGLNIALNFEWFNNDYVTLITDIGYIQKGFKEEIMMTTVDNPESGPLKTFDTRFDYMYFSPQLKIRKEFNDFIPYVFAGPRIDYQLFYKSDFELSVIEKDFEKIIFGLNYGLGIAYRIKGIGISLEFTNFYDFTNIMNTQPTQNTTGLKIRNNAFTINLGIHYYLKQKDN